MSHRSRTAATVAFVVFVGMLATPSARSADQPAKHEGKTLDEWVAVMNDAKLTIEKRRHTARVLGRFGKPAIPHLTATFKQPYLGNDTVSWVAAESLARMGGDDVRDALVQSLRAKSRDEQFFAFAAAALMRDPGKAAPDLLAWVADDSLFYRPKAEELTREIDPAVMVPVLLEKFNERNSAQVVVAAQGLCRFGPGAKPALDTARKLLTHKSVEVAALAAQVLEAIGPDAEPAVPDLIRAFAQPFERGKVAGYAERAVIAVGKPSVPALVAGLKNQTTSPPSTISVLGRIGSPHANDAVPHLLRIVETRSPAGLVEHAVLALGGFPDKGDDIAPVLLAVIEDEKWRTARSPALRSLARLGPKAKPAGDKIAAVLAEKAGHDRDAAMQAAFALGPDGKACVPPLVGFMTAKYQPEGSNLNQELEKGLPRFGAAAVPELMKVFDAEELEGTRRTQMDRLVIRILGEIGEPSKEVAPKLRALARDTKQQRELRVVCIEALAKIKADPKQDLPLLAELLAEPEPYKDGPRTINETAAKAVGTYGPAAKELAPLLLKTVQPDKKRLLREYATVAHSLAALPALGVPAEDAVPALLEYLSPPTSNEAHLAQRAAEALATYGPKAKAAVPQARALLDSYWEESRVRACELLGAIGPDAKEALPDLRELTFDSAKNVRAAAREAIKKIEK